MFDQVPVLHILLMRYILAKSTADNVSSSSGLFYSIFSM